MKLTIESTITLNLTNLPDKGAIDEEVLKQTLSKDIMTTMFKHPEIEEVTINQITVEEHNDLQS